MGFNGGTIDISDSLISENNNSGFEFYSPQQVKIFGSSIINNATFGVYSNPGVSIDARNNWWGSIDGPQEMASPDVQVEPWLHFDPLIAQVSCCSNIIFLPGLEASRLYNKTLLGENQLWEGNIAGDTVGLYLDAAGKSIDKNIYAKDVIDRTNLPAFNIDIYRTFFDSLDKLVEDSVITTWDTYPYDWRLNVDEILKDGTLTKSGRSYLLEMVEKISSQSKTQKVTVITHSNGGLLAKALIRELERQGKESLIDQVIFVAFPELGAPKALGVVLHGIDHSLGEGIILNQAFARTLGENMPGAYNLFPSEQYFTSTKTPVIYFDQSLDSISNLRLKYGNAISDWATLASFLRAEKDGRSKSLSLTYPHVGNNFLIDTAHIFHKALDSYSIPSSIHVHKIAGNNIDTIVAMRYYKKSLFSCLLSICRKKDFFDFSPVFSKSGDGTVPIASAHFGSSTPYTIDVAAYNNSTKQNRNHADIMEVTSVQQIINTIVTQKERNIISENIELNTLKISMHSPATIDLYDSDGRHTGPLQGTASTTLQFYETKIPNSYYFSYGEGVYSGITPDPGSIIKISGAGVGTFTLHVGEDVFEDIPVLPETQGEIKIEHNKASILDMDLNGDGQKDFTVDTQSSFDPVAYLTVMKTVISTLETPQKTKDNLISKIDNAVKKIQAGKMKQVDKIIKNSIKHIEFKNSGRKKITSEDATLLITLLHELLDSI